MEIQTIRACEVQGKPVPAGLVFDLPPEAAEALCEAGDAEPWAPPARTPTTDIIASRQRAADGE